MPVGIEVISDNGSRVFDQNMQTLAVSDSGTYPANPPPFSSIRDMVAKGQELSGSFKWWKFSPVESTEKFGLQVFDATGKLTFCAARKSARFVDSFLIGRWDNPPVTRSYPSGRTYAVFSSVMQFTDVEKRGVGITEEYKITNRFVTSSVNGISVTAGWDETLINDWQPVPPGGIPSFPSPAYAPVIIVLDVTNY